MHNVVSKTLFTDVEMGSGVSSAVQKSMENNTNKLVPMDKEFLMKVLHLNKMWPLKDWQKDLLILMGLLTLAEELVLKNPICCR